MSDDSVPVNFTLKVLHSSGDAPFITGGKYPYSGSVDDLKQLVQMIFEHQLVATIDSNQFRLSLVRSYPDANFLGVFLGPPPLVVFEAAVVVAESVSRMNMPLWAPSSDRFDFVSEKWYREADQATASKNWRLCQYYGLTHIAYYLRNVSTDRRRARLLKQFAELDLSISEMADMIVNASNAQNHRDSIAHAIKAIQLERVASAMQQLRSQPS